MAGLVITIAQRKGGAGKTTLAAQLAVAWLRQGLPIALLDIDPDLAESGALIASTRIGNRVALVRAMSSGLGVAESAGASPAAAEIGALADEVRRAGNQGREVK